MSIHTSFTFDFITLSLGLLNFY